MNSVILDFEERVKEIELYFNHLKLILEKEAMLYFPNNQTRKTKIIELELTKVLKANCFLLLYNLSESSIRQALIEIYNHISSKNIDYNLVNDEIKKIWITHHYKDFKKLNVDEILNVLNNIANDIINVNFETTNIKIGGSIDRRKINYFAKTIGFSDKVHHTLNNGNKLHLVKTRRNQLAHGEISFAQCGKNYSKEDLLKTKSQTIKYLRKILLNIKDYLESEKYKL